MATLLNIPNYTVSNAEDDLNKSFRIYETSDENENPINDIQQNEELPVMLTF